MPQRETRIPAEQLTDIRDRLFSRQKLTGADLARVLGQKEITFWSWFSRRGVPLSCVDGIADAITEWAQELLQIAADLRRLKKEATEPHRDPAIVQES